jgi:hypothetical protein
MEKQKFEDKWKDAFRNAEESPSENVWTNLELGLERTEASVMKQKLVFYKMLAAASVLFALSVCAAGLYIFTNQKDNFVASNQKSQLPSVSSKPVDENNVIQKEADESIKMASEGSSTSQTSLTKNKEIAKSLDNSGGASNRATAPLSYSAARLRSEQEVALMQESELPELISIQEPELKIISVRNVQNIDPVTLMLAKLEAREKELISEKTEKKNKREERFWTSLGFAAGAFSPSSGSSVAPTASNMSLQANNTVASKEAKASGTAYTMGVNVGKRVAARWIVQGGVNYLSRSSAYTAETVIGSSDLKTFRPAAINELRNIDNGARTDSKLVTTAPYNVNNSVKYLSMPLQAGFLVVDQRFGVQLNAGVATEMFLQNVKSGEGQLQKVEDSRVSDSPYRAFNFSGMMGTEVSYKFAKHYRVALNPGMRYPFQSIYKTSTGVQSSPLTFDVGLRFRYIFR